MTRKEQWLPILVLVIIVLNLLFVLFYPAPPLGDGGPAANHPSQAPSLLFRSPDWKNE